MSGRRAEWRPAAACVLAALALSACATSSAMRRGAKAELNDELDRAVVEYTQAVREHPASRDAITALQRTKLKASQAHFLRGRRLAATGRNEEALAEYQLAAELNPSNGEIDDEMRRTRVALRTKLSVSRDGKTALESLIELSRDVPPPGYELPHDAKLPASLVFREASTRDVLTAVARFANVNVAFDTAFRDAPMTIELRNASLTDALTSITGSSRNFWRVTAPRTVTIVPDTPAKRREYEEEIVRTFYLSNAELKETIDLLRIVVDLRRLAGVPGTNAITIKDTPDRVAAAGKVIAAIDKARPEVVIDVELLEVNRSRLKEYGLQVASPGSPGINGAVDVNQPNMTLQTLLNLTQADVFLTNLPGLYYRLLKSDANTRTLANPQLRTSEGIAAQARFGDRVPVPVTTFSPIASGGVSQQPITSFNYENIGVNIDITPRTHHNDDVSLALKVELSNISGTGFGGLPTFGNRSVTTVIRLKDGETNLLGGLIRDEERTTLDGVPGLSDLPLIGQLFGHTKKESIETDIVLMLTPHIIRVLDLSESDLRPFRVGPDIRGPIVELPPPGDAPPRDVGPRRQEPADAPPPGGQPARPILPPTSPPTQPPPAEPPSL